MTNLQPLTNVMPHSLPLIVVRPHSAKQCLATGDDVPPCPPVSAPVESRRRQAIRLAAAGFTVAGIALRLDRSVRQVRRYMDEPEVRAELKRQHHAELDQLQRFATKAATRSARALDDIAGDEKAPLFARISAAKAILEFYGLHSERFIQAHPKPARIQEAIEDHFED